ncbi:hypothetical protein LCGC14_0143590 [marine sediment metagenome]|uniref:Uncharacterized protein n=1 Tax=marine sediment metagenome TaxID=412755 RepID=A0A0F9V0B5_9ZZZZ
MLFMMILDNNKHIPLSRQPEIESQEIDHIQSIFDRRHELISVYLDEMDCSLDDAYIALIGGTATSDNDKVLGILTSNEAETRQYIALMTLYKQHPDRKHLEKFARKALEIGMSV